MTNATKSSLPLHEYRARNKRNLEDWTRYGPVDRCQWMKGFLKPYPPPDKYNKKSFLELLGENPVEFTCGFRNEGRQRSVDHAANLERRANPGFQYEYDDLSVLLQKKPSTYPFKTTRRKTKDMLRTLIDVSIDVPPGKYETQGFLSIDSSKSSNTASSFKSVVKRLPSKEFVGKLGPSPGEYELGLPELAMPVTSSFKSKSARFNYARTNYPGPGTYDKMYHYPPSANIRNMGRQHGLFFSTSFCV